jgi:hypothetical protein
VLGGGLSATQFGPLLTDRGVTRGGIGNFDVVVYFETVARLDGETIM